MYDNYECPNSAKGLVYGCLISSVIWFAIIGVTFAVVYLVR